MRADQYRLYFLFFFKKKNKTFKWFLLFYSTGELRGCYISDGNEEEEEGKKKPDAGKIYYRIASVVDDLSRLLWFTFNNATTAVLYILLMMWK